MSWAHRDLPLTPSLVRRRNPVSTSLPSREGLRSFPPLLTKEGRAEVYSRCVGGRSSYRSRAVSPLRLASWLCLVAVSVAGCDALPGRPTEADRPLRPSEVKNFAQLYSQNCSGCHGADGKFGAALALDNPVYLALVDDAVLRRAIVRGVPGTAAPPLARSAGGPLTDEQVDILINGIRQRWGRPDAVAGAALPPYAGDGTGDAARGGEVYTASCQSCHGPGGTGGPQVGSIVDPSYLALVSDQALRTLVIAGRPDLGHPDWRGYPPGQPLTRQQVSDVVAWLATHRTQFPGQPYPQNARGEVKQ
jgi:cytochrome c oxidase cbb3-type subunit 3